MDLVDSKRILIVGFGLTGKSIANYCIKKKIPFSIYDQKQSTEVIKQSPLSALAKNIPVFSLSIIAGKVKNMAATLNDLKPLIDLSPSDIKTFKHNLKQHRRQLQLHY